MRAAVPGHPPTLYRNIRRRPNSLPLFWRAVADSPERQGYLRFRDQLLVLNACGIPCKTITLGGRAYIYVPPLLEQYARHELNEYTRERARPAPAVTPLRTFSHAYLALLALLPLILWHGWRVGWWAAPQLLPAPATWADLGMLDSIRIRIFHEWHRLVCSLTLHADPAHLWGNVAFGALFLALLARLTGVGRTLWLTVSGGVLGNGLSLLLRPAEVLSMGFSTALFACVGALAGFMAGQEQHRRKAVLPIAAGAALLAMLGTEGEHTDSAAHCSGLLCGLALGLIEAWRSRRARLRQLPAAAAALLLPLAAWWAAFAG
ncbi:MAG: rhomboid family intramembrane serine protease [Desulfovibrio sp.]|nr:rhomboid family intramembrane serine protease [Desulfovibrio sp.]